MLALPAPSGNSKVDSLPAMALVTSEGSLNPPIITHTAATPMATPQGSPNEHVVKDTNHKLSVSINRSALKDSEKPVSKTVNFHNSIAINFVLST